MNMNDMTEIGRKMDDYLMKSIEESILSGDGFWAGVIAGVFACYFSCGLIDIDTYMNISAYGISRGNF